VAEGGLDRDAQDGDSTADEPRGGVVQCPGVPLPSTQVQFFAGAPEGPTQYEGLATVEEVETSTLTGLTRGVRLQLSGEAAVVEVSNYGTIFPSFEVGQELRLRIVSGAPPGNFSAGFIVIRSAQGDLLLAYHNTHDGPLRNGTVRDVLGFDLALRTVCQRQSDCFVAPTEVLTATLISSGVEVDLPVEQPVTVDLDGAPYSVVWQDGRVQAGLPTGACSDVVLGTMVTFLVVRQEL
jgi:hypothetical protein